MLRAGVAQFVGSRASESGYRLHIRRVRKDQAFVDFLDPRGAPIGRPYMGGLCSAKNLIVLNFRRLFMPLASPVGIRDAGRPEQVFLSPGDRTEYGDLKFGAPECLPTVREYRVTGWSVGGLGCSSGRIQRATVSGGVHGVR